MPFSQLLSPQPKTLEEFHKILGLISTCKGKHYLYSTPSGFGKSNLLAAAVADLLKSQKKVQIFSTKDKEDLLIKILAPLSGHSVQDLKNPNFINQDKVQAVIKDLSEKYKDFLQIQQCSSSARNPFLKVEPFISSDCDVVFIDDIQELPDSRDEYAKKMNILINDLNALAEKKNLVLVSFSSYPVMKNSNIKFDVVEAIPPYLKNKDNELIIIDPPYNTDKEALNIRKGTVSAVLKLFTNNEYFISESAKLVFANPPYSQGNVVHMNNFAEPQMKNIMKKEFTIQEINELRRELDSEFSKGEPNYERIKTLSSRLSKASGEVSKF